MGDPSGFLKHGSRETPVRRPVPLRLLDWKEVYEPFPRDTLRTQASRCMDCGIPFCHNGCPLGNLIPEWNDLVYKGKWEDGIERLHATNNFPEFTGRLCPAPCEASCVLGINQDPVTIKQVEVELIEKAFDDNRVTPVPPSKLTGKKVAVVGSGPAGLAAAQQLTRAGHTVTVFEREDRIGGLLRHGIPEFKMEKHFIDRRLAQMEAEGTVFKPGVNVGVDITADELREQFDAVVLAGDSVDPHNGKCVRSSAGSIFHLPVARERDTDRVLATLAEAGVQILATAADGEIDLDDADELLAAPTAWLFGNEAHGLDPQVAARADHRVRIPIRGRAESLNLATAASICLYASARVQHRAARPIT